MKVNEPCGFVVNKVDGLIYGDVGWPLGYIGLKVGYDPCMFSGGGVADAVNL